MSYMTMNEMQKRIAELEQQVEALEVQATHDTMTGCLNRRGLERAEARMVARADRAGIPARMMWIAIDLDGLKAANAQGHARGDALIVAAAAALQASVRSDEGAVARVGGDEFVVLLENVDLPTARQIAQRCRTAMLAVGVHATIGIGATQEQADANQTAGKAVRGSIVF